MGAITDVIQARARTRETNIALPRFGKPEEDRSDLFNLILLIFLSMIDVQVVVGVKKINK